MKNPGRRGPAKVDPLCPTCGTLWVVNGCPHRAPLDRNLMLLEMASEPHLRPKRSRLDPHRARLLEWAAKGMSTREMSDKLYDLGVNVTHVGIGNYLADARAPSLREWAVQEVIDPLPDEDLRQRVRRALRA